MRTVGVEEELLLVEPGTGEALPVASSLLGADDPLLDGEFLEEMVEVQTRPHTSADGLLDELCALRRHAAARAATVGAAPAGLATLSLASGGHVREVERYRRIWDTYGALARGHLTCGCHVHVGVADEHEGVGVLDGVRNWLPTLMALTAGSPFHAGADTGFASYRWQLTARWPVSGPPPWSGSSTAYHQYVDALIDQGLIFDEGMLYLDARLSAHVPTVEIRIADVSPDVRDTVGLALLVRALVETEARRWRAGRGRGQAHPPVSTSELQRQTWLASWRGLSGPLVDPRSGRPVPAARAVGELLRHVRPALVESGDRPEVEAWVEGLLGVGGEAGRQRAVLESTGSLGEVVADAVRRTVELPR
ncbi:carboxylate-amine ligase [Ornithinimicrobium tianjinense]|uniref:Putative glutamate--cysteine ligase 2 n=1 Tax=Ornithinimicrobium tianjinense TaxID=1195761 RepID=A0A917BU87_9MICO|nr:glutamate--cysteine ligase [Ornithinimicrobium tianjinense]GGF56913.1 putative glutamate--cysteine ligase 2 [Ornithinimicrobium tianjinense]